ncbi:hypothetical protein [Microlunatus aurantiacus]
MQNIGTEPTRARRRLLAVIATLVLAIAAALLPASKAAAVPEITGNVVEHYQWCYNRKPIPSWAGSSWYITAVGSSGGVTCQWWVMYDNKFVPVRVDTWYTWDTVCRSLGWRGGYWNGVARCYR